MTLVEADQAARRIWETGRCISTLSPRGRYMIGPTRNNGTFAGFYYGNTLASLVYRAQRQGTYDVLTDTDGNVIGGGKGDYSNGSAVLGLQS